MIFGQQYFNILETLAKATNNNKKCILSIIGRPAFSIASKLPDLHQQNSQNIQNVLGTFLGIRDLKTYLTCSETLGYLFIPPNQSHRTIPDQDCNHDHNR